MHAYMHGLYFLASLKGLRNPSGETAGIITAVTAQASLCTEDIFSFLGGVRASNIASNCHDLSIATYACVAFPETVVWGGGMDVR